MDMDRLSGLKFYSIGIVVKDKEFGKDIIEVDPIELMNLDDGKIKDDDRVHTSSLPDHQGVSKSATVKGGSVIKAKWLCLNSSNRDTAPDVYRNETVMLYRFADEQEYYWTDLLREPGLRKLERARYIYSNVEDPSPDANYDKDKAYWGEVSTKDQMVHFHTSDNREEVTTYDIRINTKAGILRIEDGFGNYLELDSPQHTWTLHANKIIKIYGDDTVEIKTKNFLVDALNRIEEKTDVFNEIAGTHTTKAGNVTHDTPVVNNTNLTTTAKLQAGSIDTGNVEVSGNIHATGTIIDDAGNTNHHSH